ncbi:hypothetical protein V6N12_023187 [Hibiscus sabdariffa]|uniref:Uncharacterized protein n=1 Tax=Hibiscus sabdariffa TaxID=183260 RepID=A0ABR2FX98_9ROSI
MQALHDGIGNHPMATVPPSLPLGTHPAFDGVGPTFGAQLKSLLMEHPSNAPHHLIPTKQQRLTIFPGECKSSRDEHKPQAVISLQSDPSENPARFELGFGQPMGCAKYQCMDQFYGVFSTYGAQISEVIQPHLPVRLPCYDFTPVTSPAFGIPLLVVKITTSGMASSRSVTGGVCKAWERIHRRMADRRLLAIPASCRRVAACNPN